MLVQFYEEKIAFRTIRSEGQKVWRCGRAKARKPEGFLADPCFTATGSGLFFRLLNQRFAQVANRVRIALKKLDLVHYALYQCHAHAALAPLPNVFAQVRIWGHDAGRKNGIAVIFNLHIEALLDEG